MHIVAAGGNPHVMVLLLEYGDSGKLMRDGLSILFRMEGYIITRKLSCPGVGELY